VLQLPGKRGTFVVNIEMENLNFERIDLVGVLFIFGLIPICAVLLVRLCGKSHCV
jgi:hypothetical protein